MKIRPETPADETTIAALITEAFLSADHAAGTEALIVNCLRSQSALTLSLVAEESGGHLTGHIAASPVTLDGRAGWCGIGPVSVRPAYQRQGIGHALMIAAMDQLEQEGANGIVLVGDPGYYGRFGFSSQPGLSAGDIPSSYVMARAFGEARAEGEIEFPKAFGVNQNV